MSDFKIMLVEDEGIIAMGLEMKLKSWGFPDCEIITSGEEAVNASFQMKPDLILMDIGLKGEVDGIEVVRRISSLNIPIIYITGRNDGQEVKDALQTLPYALLKKPVNHDVLKHKIKSALEEQKRLVKKNRESG